MLRPSFFASGEPFLVIATSKRELKKAWQTHSILCILIEDFRMRILILDDHAGLADMLALSLRVAGHSAIGFTRPTEALAALQESDILVTDYHLPEMTGLELARRAYAQGWRGSLLLMSGRPADIGEAIEHPLLHIILHKPFSTRILIESLPKPS
jgi:DNA-binding response OmpR family regulator